MEFSGFSYCAENKKLNFASFMSSGTLIQQTSNMGINNSSEIPFVELTGHKMQNQIVNSSFEIKDFASSFSISGKIHSFTANAKTFVRSDNILMRKDLYSHQFPSFSFSQLVGGFVGSKSQIGSSSKESCQVWDIIFEKLEEFCGTHQHPKNCSNFDVLKSFSKKEKSPTIIQNLPNVISNNKLSPSNNTQHISSSSQTSDNSKQSYAEVARNFATIQQNKPSAPIITMPRRNLHNRRNFAKCEISRTITNNWRNECTPRMKEYRKHTRFFSGPQRRSDNINFKSNRYSEKKQKTDENREHNYRPESQRVDIKNNFKQTSSDSVQISPKISTHHECGTVREISSQSSSNANQVGQTSPKRMRVFSDCSTDSDDSFVVFDYEGADPDACNTSIKSCSTTDSDLSEDTFTCEFSDDGDDYDTDSVDGDIKFVIDLDALNKRWQTENSEYPAYEKDPVKVHFASDDSLETVHRMIAWDFAYRAARRGIWEQIGRDHERFNNRIKAMEPVLAQVLCPEHRCRVWKERMSSMLAVA